MLIVHTADLISNYAQNEQNFNAVERVRLCSCQYRRSLIYFLGTALHWTSIRRRDDHAQRPTGVMARTRQDPVRQGRFCLSRGSAARPEGCLV